MSATSERPDPLAEPEGYGSKLPPSLQRLTIGHDRPAETAHGPEQYEQVASHMPGVAPPDDNGCTWYEPGTDIRCPAEREWVYAVGDLAEHIAEQGLCDNHLTRVFSVSRFWCTICKQDMRVEKIGAVVDGEVVWLDKDGWPERVKRKLPPEHLF